MKNLDEIRVDIDRVDKEIVKIFEERMELCKEVAEYKIANGKQVLDITREKCKIQDVKKLAKDDFNKHGVEELFKQIMAMSRKLQYQILADHGMLEDISYKAVDTIKNKDIKIVYQGVEGAYAHEAVLQYFGKECNDYHVKSWRDAMEEVKAGRADYAVMPIENSTAGPISEVYDLLIEYDNYIVAETYVKVEHALLGLVESSIEDIKTVFSHPQGLMQCGKYLEEHKEWKQMSFPNTAGSAKKIFEEGDKSQAAIASITAGNLYGLKVLKEKINNSDVNTTRFVIVGKEKIYTNEADKISICVEIPHEEGSLYSVLSHFIYNNINMTKIESRPLTEKKWEYRFFIDIEGKLGDASVKNALRGISEEVNRFVVLGNY